jgi:DNA-binding CsgD family transcriptional regulator
MKSKPVLPACSTNIPSLPADGDGGAIRKGNQDAGAASQRAEIEQAEARTERAERRTEEARSRTEAAETRTEQAESRTELAKTRTEQAENRTERAEMRTEQVETILQRVIDSRIAARPEISAGLQKALPMPGNADEKVPLEQLTKRQREILQLIAGGQNTKQTADILKLSPKTVEYHRMKLMNRLNIHDVPGLVRFALRVGLIPPEG